MPRRNRPPLWSELTQDQRDDIEYEMALRELFADDGRDFMRRGRRYAVTVKTAKPEYL